MNIILGVVALSAVIGGLFGGTYISLFEKDPEQRRNSFEMAFCKRGMCVAQCGMPIFKMKSCYRSCRIDRDCMNKGCTNRCFYDPVSLK